MEKTFPNDNIGMKFKNLRKKKGITLKQLSGLSGLSIACLSKLERGESKPSLENTLKLCEVLEISIYHLLKEDSLSHIVLRSQKKRIIYEEENMVTYESISFAHGKLPGIIITIQPHYQNDKTNWSHDSDEIGYIIEGGIEMEVNNELIHLDQGDSIYIDAGVKHNISNKSDEKSVSIWIRHGY